MNKWLLIGGGVAAYLIYKAMQIKQTVDQLTILPYGVKYDSNNSNALQTQLLITLRINNPTANSVSFSSFQGNVFINGSDLCAANYAPGSGTTIAANTFTDIIVPVSFQNITIGVRLLGFISSWITGIVKPVFKITGSIVVSGLSIPISAEYRISGVSRQHNISNTRVYG